MEVRPYLMGQVLPPLVHEGTALPLINGLTPGVHEQDATSSGEESGNTTTAHVEDRIR